MCAVREDSLENICIICICIGFVGHRTADGKHLLGRAADDHVVAHVAAQEHRSRSSRRLKKSSASSSLLKYIFTFPFLSVKQIDDEKTEVWTCPLGITTSLSGLAGTHVQMLCQKAHTSVEGELADILSCTFAL